MSALAVNPTANRGAAGANGGLAGHSKIRGGPHGVEPALASDFPQNTEVQFRMASLELAEKKYPQAEARFEQLYQKG